MYIKNSSYRISFPHPPTLPHPHPHTHAHTFCQGKPGDDGDQGAFGDVVSTAFTTGIFELPVIICLQCLPPLVPRVTLAHLELQAPKDHLVQE